MQQPGLVQLPLFMIEWEKNTRQCPDFELECTRDRDKSNVQLQVPAVIESLENL